MLPYQHDGARQRHHQTMARIKKLENPHVQFLTHAPTSTRCESGSCVLSSSPERITRTNRGQRNLLADRLDLSPCSGTGERFGAGEKLASRAAR